MNYWLLFTTILSSTAFGTVVGAIINSRVLKRNNDNNLRLKYITEERGKWRELIKEKVSLIYSGSHEDTKELRKLLSEVILSLNPYDNDEDHKIIACLKRVESDPRNTAYKKRLRLLVAHMLKHDWERSKKEAGLKSNNLEITIF